jgi:hypothetical protein
MQDLAKQDLPKQDPPEHLANHPAHDDPGSAYRSAFRRGATLLPRLLCLVERRAAGRPGGDPAAPLVVSRRNNQAKEPWKSLAGVEHPVEAEFLRPVLLGENILPFRLLSPPEGVIPVVGSTVLDAQGAAISGFAGLKGWMAAAEAVWDANAQRSDMTLTDRLNYQNALAAQFPLAPLRVVYAASGAIPAACLIRQSPAVVEHGLYWSEVATEDEGRYLLSVFNSETTRTVVKELLARDLWGARNFDKVVFTLPIPKFDRAESLHAELAATAAEAELAAAAVEIPALARFQRARQLTHDALTVLGISERIDWLVAQLLRG